MEDFLAQYGAWLLAVATWITVAFAIWKLKPWFEDRRENPAGLEKVSALRSSRWTLLKIVALIAFAAMTAFATGSSEGSLAPWPTWAGLLAMPIAAILSRIYLSFYPASQRYTELSIWPAFPFSLYRDPLPFVHFAGWVMLCAGATTMLVDGLAGRLTFEAISNVAMGAGFLAGIALLLSSLRNKSAAFESGPSS